MECIRAKDALPEEGVKVLSYLKKYNEIKIDYIIYVDKPLWACILERDENEVTHWMPLPQPPKE